MRLKMASDVLRLPDIGFRANLLISSRNKCPQIGAIRKDRFNDIDQKLVFVVGDSDGTTFRCSHLDYTCEVMFESASYEAKVVDVDI